MKLNNKRTFLIGLAFFSICAFWQAYDFVIPLILKHRFSLGDDIAGFVMALDNILALFLLPLFGTLSDRCQSRLGKRMPFIVAGTVAASVLMIALPFADLAGRLGVFIVLLGLLLIAMGTYRSPAVALMPDLTPKPLRSRANAIINLMGAIGGIYALLMINLLVTGEPAENPSYLPLFVSVAALMLLSVALLVITVRERKIAASLPPEPEETAPTGTGEKLPRAMLRSLVLILLSVFFWFMGYNAVTSAFSKYYTQAWGAVSGAANCMMIATGGAVVMYVPVGIVSSRFGPQEGHSGGRGAPGRLLCPWGALGEREFPQRSVHSVRAGGRGLGDDQCEFVPHGGGNQQGGRRGKVYGLLLYVFHGGSGAHAHPFRPVVGKRWGITRCFPTRRRWLRFPL